MVFWVVSYGLGCVTVVGLLFVCPLFWAGCWWLWCFTFDFGVVCLIWFGLVLNCSLVSL